MRLKGAITLVAISAGSVSAGGVDRSGQSIGILFERGNYAELSFGLINPSVSGNDLAGFGGRGTGGVAGNHNLPGLAIKYDFNDRVSGALIYDQAYGADIDYATAADGGSVMLGGTSAKLDSQGITGILRYKFDERFSIHGGIRASQASGDVTLAGAAYSRLPGGRYAASFDKDWGTGFLLGAAYEIPDIALRVAVTYFSEVKHSFDTRENGFATGETDVKTPQAVNLDFQTGVAKDTLVFGSIRWVDWKVFQITPPVLGVSLTDLENTTTYTLGVGRKFNDNWSGSIFATYEPKGNQNVSPLAPMTGQLGLGVGAVYTQDNMKVTFGARYVKLGDANAAPSNVPVARMADNKAVAFGIKVGFSF